MAQTLPVYAVASLLLVAGSGPALQAMRDASLAEFEALNEWRSLDEFPFLKEVRDYLPPVVVDWIIVQRDTPRDLPPGVDYRFDRDGRVVMIWPDGCEETQDQYETASECAPPPDDPCADPTHPDCTPEPPQPPECPAGEMTHPDWPNGDTDCIPDPACSPDDNGSVPARCPPPPPPPPTECDNGTVRAYDDTCVPVKPTLLRSFSFPASTNELNEIIELKVAFSNLSIEVSWTGLTNPGWEITSTAQHSTLCFTRSDGGTDDGDGCDPQRVAGILPGSAGQASYADTHADPIPAQNITMSVRYDGGATQTTTLYVRIYGTPREATDETTDA